MEDDILSSTNEKHPFESAARNCCETDPVTGLLVVSFAEGNTAALSLQERVQLVPVGIQIEPGLISA